MNRILEAIAVIFVQVVVLNHLDFSAYIMPQVFILLLINLPPYLNKSVQVLLAFVLGLIADFFVATPGIHAASCMTLVMLRFAFISRMDLDEVIADRAKLSVRTLSLDKYLPMSGSLVLFYHLMVFGLESIGAINWPVYFMTVLVSSMLSFLIILLIQFLFYRK